MGGRGFKSRSGQIFFQTFIQLYFINLILIICYFQTFIQLYMYGLLTKREVKMTGYWPSSFFACLWTETKSRSINTQKKNEANIQSS